MYHMQIISTLTFQKKLIFRKTNWFLKRWRGLWDPVEPRQKWQDSTQPKRNLKNHLEQKQRRTWETALIVWHVGLITCSKLGLCRFLPLPLLFSQNGEADSHFWIQLNKCWKMTGQVKKMFFIVAEKGTPRTEFTEVQFLCNIPPPWIKSCQHVFLTGMSLFLLQQNRCFSSGTKCAVSRFISWNHQQWWNCWKLNWGGQEKKKDVNRRGTRTKTRRGQQTERLSE